MEAVARTNALTWEDLVPVDGRRLRHLLERLLEHVVAGDSRSTRSDDRLNQGCNLLLVKLESDRRARLAPTEPVVFQSWGSETADRIGQLFSLLRQAQPQVFNALADTRLELDPGTVELAAQELGGVRLLDAPAEVVSNAFQVLRAAGLRSGEGQYFTPHPVVRSAVRVMHITSDDRVIDPACGTGGFLIEAVRDLLAEDPDLDLSTWAAGHLMGVDRDAINVKLTRALLLLLGTGDAVGVQTGDSLRRQRWSPNLATTLADGGYTCVITNPPFGKTLKLRADDAREAGFTITRVPRHARSRETEFDPDRHGDLGLGLAFLERCHDLLRPGGRLGIVLPETYFFSPSYAWLQAWLRDRFILRGMFGIPMEAFQRFCRAKTSFYVFQKPGQPSTGPAWFREGRVLVSNASTCGLNKDGDAQFKVDRRTGQRSNEIDDRLLRDSQLARQGKLRGGSLSSTPLSKVQATGILAPSYFDRAPLRALDRFLRAHPDFSARTLDELQQSGILTIRFGHGSPSLDQRVGDVPYIKVSDLRAGRVNVNLTNLIPRSLATRLWRGESSGLAAWDLISPVRASKNIGEFCVLLPGQEDVVLTKEIIVIRPGPEAPFDGFFLMWALSLSVVREQWRRVILMQTNREDVGDRWREIRLPIPERQDLAQQVAAPFRAYQRALTRAEQRLLEALEGSGYEHHRA